jgi:hypothetical protein
MAGEGAGSNLLHFYSSNIHVLCYLFFLLIFRAPDLWEQIYLLEMEAFENRYASIKFSSAPENT